MGLSVFALFALSLSLAAAQLGERHARSLHSQSFASQCSPGGETLTCSAADLSLGQDVGINTFNSPDVTSWQDCQQLCFNQAYEVLWGDFHEAYAGAPATCDCYTVCDNNTIVYKSAEGWQSFAVAGCEVKPTVNTTVEPLTSAPVETAPNILNDPHFVGAHGTRFDFNGELGASYCLVADRDVHINGLLGGYSSNSIVGASVSTAGKGIRSWIRQLGILWVDAEGKRHSLHLEAVKGKVATGSRYLVAVSLDGAVVKVPAAAGLVLEKFGLTLSFSGVEVKGAHAEEMYRLQITDVLDATLALAPASPQFQLPEDSEVHFNLIFRKLQATRAVHGVLGQTFRTTGVQVLKAMKYSFITKLLGEPVKADGASGRGFLDGDIVDYKTSHVLEPNCRFSSLRA